MLEDYLTQRAILKRKIDSEEPDLYNEPVFEEIEIDCRIIEKFKQVTNDKGEIVVSSGIIQCVDAIKVGDYINDRKVIAVSSMTALDGILGYKGYLL